jgi:flavorubredoxin
MEKNGKYFVAEIKSEFKRHTNILMEQVHREVKIVAEGHGAIIRKLEEHDKRFDKVDAKLAEHDVKFAEHDVKFAEHDKKFAVIESELNTIKMALIDTSHRVDHIDKIIGRIDNRAN